MSWEIFGAPTAPCRAHLAEERTDFVFPAASSCSVCQNRAGGDDYEKKQLAVFSFGIVAVQAVMSFAPGNWGFVRVAA